MSHLFCSICIVDLKQVNVSWHYNLFPGGNYMFKVNNRNTRTRCEICSKLTINIPERHHRLYHKVFQMFAICVFPEFPQNFFYTKLRNSSWLSVGKVTLNSSAEASFSSLMYVVCICKFG